MGQVLVLSGQGGVVVGECGVGMVCMLWLCGEGAAVVVLGCGCVGVC